MKAVEWIDQNIVGNTKDAEIKFSEKGILITLLKVIEKYNCPFPEKWGQINLQECFGY